MKGAVTMALGVCALAAGCRTVGPGGPAPYEEYGVAETGSSWLCARNEVRTLGYLIVSAEGNDYLLAEKEFDAGRRGERTLGSMRVAVTANQPPGKETVRIHGERVAVNRSGRTVTGNDPDGWRGPHPGPQPYDTTWTHRGRRPSESRRRVDPGPVAADARRVLDRCTSRAFTDQEEARNPRRT